VTPTSFLGDLGRILIAVECSGIAGSLALAEGLERATELIRRQTQAGQKVMFVGNGGSAAIASHQATDYLKNGGMKAIAFNDAALLTCLANDLGYERVFEKQIEMLADRGDVLIAISSSGKSENILRAAAAAREAGCRVVTMSGFAQDNPLRMRGEINFYVPSQSYGFVEITHLALCHSIVDTIIARGR
jgi:D-sedoheptulose 7-phosphate isomerase